jgi:hypothetical protein
VRPEDDRWARLEAQAIAGLVTSGLRLRLPGLLEGFLRRLRRAAR